MKRNTKPTALPIRPKPCQFEAAEIYSPEKWTPMYGHEDTEQILKDPATDLNYLALSDTDTLSCYTVPSPIYPTLTTQETRQLSVNFYCPADEKSR